VDRVSINPLISPPIQRTSHLRVTVGTIQAHLIRPRLRLRILTPPLRGRSSRRGSLASRKTLWISLQGEIRGRTCRRPCKVRVSSCFHPLYVIGRRMCFILEFPNREGDEHREGGWARVYLPAPIGPFGTCLDLVSRPAIPASFFSDPLKHPCTSWADG